jgi:hypothetical protein
MAVDETKAKLVQLSFKKRTEGLSKDEEKEFDELQKKAVVERDKEVATKK